MACGLTLSKTLGCIDGIGGVKTIKIKTLPSQTTLDADYTLTSGVIAIASGSQNDWFRYDLELETAVFNSNGTGNRAQGTFFCDETGTVIFNKQSAEMRNELMAIGQSRLQIAVELQDGTYWLYGYKNGMTLSTVAGTSGTGMGDRNGYTLNWVGKESVLTPSMTAATWATL
jgi:hypothetical protein